LSSFREGDGVPIGEYTVAIECAEYPKSAANPKSFEEEISKDAPVQLQTNVSTKWIIPESYSSADSSNLRATVVKGSNVINFSLPVEGNQ